MKKGLGPMPEEIWKIRTKSLLFIEFHRRWHEAFNTYIDAKSKSRFLPCGYIEKKEPQFFDQNKENVNVNIRTEIKLLQ